MPQSKPIYTVEKNDMQAYPPDMDFELHHYNVLDSTMNMARSLALSGKGGNHIVLADFQTQGRGRIEGRRWIGSPGHSLLMTLVIGKKSGITALPMRVGLAVLDAVAALPKTANKQQIALPLALKWPNDVMGITAEKTGKLCGILCESTGESLLAGIGINLDKYAYPAELASVSTSLEELEILSPASSSRVEFEGLARTIADHVANRLIDETWQKEYVNHLWAMGKQISFIKGHPSCNDLTQGTVEGIDSEGCILLKDYNGIIRTYSSGEISSLASNVIGG